MTVRVWLSDRDFEAEATEDEKAKLETQTPVLGTTQQERREEFIRELLPRVIAKKIEKLIPEGYEVKEISMTVDVSGKVFGSGISGGVNVSFGPGRS